MVNNAEKAQDSYKSRMAQKWGIPVVSTEFIHKCVEAGKLVEVDPYVVVGKTAAKEFNSGKIIGMLHMHLCVTIHQYLWSNCVVACTYMYVCVNDYSALLLPKNTFLNCFYYFVCVGCGVRRRNKI